MSRIFIDFGMLIILVALVGGSAFHGEGHATGHDNIPFNRDWEASNDQGRFMVEDHPSFSKRSASGEGIHRRASIDTTVPTRPRVEVLTYEVETGDNLFPIADKFGLKPETVLWGNYDVLQDNPSSSGRDRNSISCWWMGCIISGAKSTA